MSLDDGIELGQLRPFDPPRIDASIGDLGQASDLAWSALVSTNVPEHYFVMHNQMVRVSRDEQGRPIIEPCDADMVRHQLSLSAKYFKPTADGKGRPARPPLDVARDMLRRAEKPVPALRGVIDSPIYSSTGKLHNTPGYDVETQLYLQTSPDLALLDVPRDPSEAEIAAAVRILCVEMIADFPLLEDADIAHYIAFLLTPLARDLITGPVPLYLIDKTTPGTGATLLLSCAFLILTGRELVAMTLSSNPEELHKTLVATLRDGPRLVVFDNVHQLGGQELSLVVTVGYLNGRILGQSTMAAIAVQAMIAASGNNVDVSTELARRVVRSRLDAKVEQPWLRNGFRHPDLRAWVRENRVGLVRALLTLISAWIAHDRPAGAARLGMFEAWSRVIGGILDVAGIPGFLGNLAQLYSESDSEAEVRRAFVLEWLDKLGTVRTSAVDLFPLAGGIDLGKGTEHSQRIRLGKYLAKLRGQVIAGVRVERAGLSGGTMMWQLVRESGA